MPLTDPFARARRRVAVVAALATGGLLAVAAPPAAAGDARAVPTAQATPSIVTRWAAAWNSASPRRMAALFTTDGVYEDLAFQATFRGREGVAS